MNRPYRVAVVGLGVAGAGLASLLARDGHQITVLERAPDPKPIGAGVLLQRSGQEVLRHFGLLDDVLAHAAPIDELYARHDTGRTLLRTRFADLEPGNRAYGVHRGVLFNALYGRVRSLPIAVRLGREVVSRTLSRDEVFLTDRVGERHGPFDIVLAADGARSQFRDACHLPASVTRYAHGTLWMIAPGTGLRGQLLQVVRGNGRLFGLLPLGDGLVTLYWGIPMAQFDQIKRAGLDPLKEEILRFSPESADVLDMVVDMSQLLLTGYQHVHQRRWYDDTTLFLGDACHAMSPHLGQGINIALLDAWHLAACLRESPSPREAFAKYHRRRRVYVDYYATVAFLLAPFFQSDWSILGLGRDLALPLLPWIPFVKRQMLLTVSGLKGGFLRGRISI